MISSLTRDLRNKNSELQTKHNVSKLCITLLNKLTRVIRSDGIIYKVRLVLKILQLTAISMFDNIMDDRFATALAAAAASQANSPHLI